MSAAEASPIGTSEPTVSLIRQFVLAIGPVGLALAGLALLVGLACSVVAGLTFYESLEASQIYEARDHEVRALALRDAAGQLMRSIERPASGYRMARPDDVSVRDAWQSFQRALDEVCQMLEPSGPRTEVLEQSCADRPGFQAMVEPEVLAFDPARHPLDQAVRHRLQRLSDDIDVLTRHVLVRTGTLQDVIADRYGAALEVLGGSAAGFALASAVLLYLLARSSVRYYAKGREAALQHARLASLVQSSGAPILLVDRDLRVLVANHEFRKLGLEPGPDGANPFNLDLELLARWRAGSIVPELRQPVLYASDLIDPSGVRRLLNVTATPVVGPGEILQGIVFVAVDDTRRWEAQRALIERARYDSLTGLSNRSYFIESARSAIEGAVRRGEGFAMLCLDLDDFKDINSTMGYPIGDRLLKAAAARLQACLGPHDLAARFGADEFTLLCLDVRDPREVDSFVRLMLEALAKPYELEGTLLRSTVSIGVSVRGPEAVRAEVVVGEADMALNRAKAAGRNSYALFTADMDREVRARVRMVQQLREGLAREEFFLVYQPRMDIRSGRVVGVEALVRWRHPDQGVLLPAAFIAVAEASGLIRELGRWVMRDACRQASLWTKAGVEIGRVGINVSALQLHDLAELESSLDLALEESGLGPDRLEIELTETALMGVGQEHSDFLQRLRTRGIAIALDDFGTGYSSLLYLRRLPVDRIKIAQEFVQDIGGGGNAAVARIAVLFGRTLGLTVVAEGVETAEQLSRLRRWGCDEAQGFLFARPLVAEELVRFLATYEPA